MSRKLGVFLWLLGACAAVGAAPAPAQNMDLWVNGGLTTAKAIRLGGATYLPLSALKGLEGVEVACGPAGVTITVSGHLARLCHPRGWSDHKAGETVARRTGGHDASRGGRTLAVLAAQPDDARRQGRTVEFREGRAGGTGMAGSQLCAITAAAYRPAPAPVSSYQPAYQGYGATSAIPWDYLAQYAPPDPLRLAPRFYGAPSPLCSGYDTSVSGFYVPGVDIPGTYIPGTYIPGTWVGDTYVPGIDVPGIDVPGFHVPGFYVPGY